MVILSNGPPHRANHIHYDSRCQVVWAQDYPTGFVTETDGELITDGESGKTGVRRKPWPMRTPTRLMKPAGGRWGLGVCLSS